MEGTENLLQQIVKGGLLEIGPIVLGLKWNLCSALIHISFPGLGGHVRIPRYYRKNNSKHNLVVNILALFVVMLFQN
jgi:hypothetical protein